MPRTIELQPVYTEEVTPQRYLSVYSKEADNIESVNIIPPRLGRKDFGGLLIKYKQPVYTSPFEKLERSVAKKVGLRMWRRRK